jgi:hypothetical protein
MGGAESSRRRQSEPIADRSRHGILEGNRTPTSRPFVVLREKVIAF